MKSQSQSEAQLLFVKAQEMYSSRSRIWSSKQSWLETGNFFQRAADQFQAEKLFKDAGDAFSKAAECHESGKAPVEATKAWIDAAEAYSHAYNCSEREQSISANT